MEGGSMSMIPSREASYRHALTDKGQGQGQGQSQGQGQVQLYDDNDQGNVWGNSFMPMPFSSILRGHLVARSGLIFQQYARKKKEDVRRVEGCAGGGGDEVISSSSSSGGSSSGGSSRGNSNSGGDEGEEVALGLRGVSLDYLRAHHGSLVHAMALPNPLKQVLLGYAMTPADNTYSNSSSGSSGVSSRSGGSGGNKDGKSSTGNDDHRHHSNSDQEGYSESKKPDSLHQVTPSPRSRTEIPQWGYLSFKEACDALEQHTRSVQQAIGGSGGGNGSYVGPGLGPGLGYSFPPEGSYGSPYDHHNKYALEYIYTLSNNSPPPPHTHIYTRTLIKHLPFLA